MTIEQLALAFEDGLIPLHFLMPLGDAYLEGYWGWGVWRYSGTGGVKIIEDEL